VELEAPALVAEPPLEPFVVPLEPLGLEAEDPLELPPAPLREAETLPELLPAPELPPPEDPSVTDVLQAANASATTRQERMRPMGSSDPSWRLSVSKICAWPLLPSDPVVARAGEAAD